MKEISKNDVKSLLGKESTWNPKRLVNKINYVSGIEPYDVLLDGKLFTEVTALINLRYRPNGVQIEMMKGFKYHSVGILEEDILSICLEDKNQLYEQKEKSVIGRAIIGGLVLGPVGAVIGGMTGIGNKESAANMPDVFLSITYKEQDEKKIALFSCKFKDRNNVVEFFTKNYGELFERSISEASSETTGPNGNIDDLMKLVELKEKGVLTEEEFSAMKQKLLK